MRKLISIQLLALVASGCAFRPQMTQVALDHNEMVARTEDELTLLNIVRASKHFPMHFTTITILRGNATASFGAESGFTLPQQGGESNFDKDGIMAGSKVTKRVETATPKLSGSISTNPSFEMGVLNTDKFQRGIQQPVKPELLEYFLDQGWPSDLIGALFIERIDLVATATTTQANAGDVVARIENDFNKSGSAERSAFRELILNHYLRASRTAGGRTALAPLQPLLGKSSLSDLALLDGKSFDTDYESAGEAGATVFRLSAPKLLFKLVPVEQHSFHDLKLVEGIFRQDAKSDEPRGTFSIGNVEVPVTMRTSLRSVQGIMYFVGEYARNADSAPLRNDVRLFTLKDGSGSAFLATRFNGMRFYIPNDSTADRSLQVLDIIQQLLNMHKSADDLPATRSVNLVR